jgi:hypothetical protein
VGSLWTLEQAGTFSSKPPEKTSPWHINPNTVRSIVHFWPLDYKTINLWQFVAAAIINEYINVYFKYRHVHLKKIKICLVRAKM